MRIVGRLAWVLCLLGFVLVLGDRDTHAQSHEPQKQVSPWNDPRLRAWSTLYLAGKANEVISAVEKDLLSSSPHRFAPHIWTVTQEARGTLEQSVHALEKNSALKGRLGALPDVYSKYQAGHFAELLDAYPPSNVASSSDYWLLRYLSFAATNRNRPRDRLLYLEIALRADRDGDLASDYLSAVTSLDGDAKVLEQARTFISSPPVVGTPVEAFLRATLPYGQTAVDALYAVDELLSKQPHDPGAEVYKAYFLHSLLQDHAGSAALYRSASLTYPWFHQVDAAAARLVRAGQPKESLKLLTDASRRIVAGKYVGEQLVAHGVIGALMGGGERGEAKREIDAALKKWPQDAWLYDQLYSYWPSGADLVHNDVDAARKAVELEPTFSRKKTLLVALRSAGKTDEALSLYERLRTETKDESELFGDGIALFEKLDRKEDRIQISEKAANAFPQSAAWRATLAYAQADGGKKSEAIKTMRSSFELAAPSDWNIDRVIDWMGSDEKGVDAFLEELRARYPWKLSPWTKTAARLKGTNTTDLKIALWKEAEHKAAGYEWPWENHVRALLDAERWEEATKVADGERAALATAPRGQQMEALLTGVWIVTSRAAKQQVPNPAIDRALAAIKEYTERHGSPSNAEWYRFRLFEALGRTKEACSSAALWSDLRPDDSDPWWALVRTCADQPGGKDRIAAKRYVDRDPDSPDRLRTLAQVGVQYWGAPVLTLGYLARLKAIAPNKDVAGSMSMAHSQLGDAKRDFELSYLHATAISPSDRYVGWYERARVNAQGPNNQISFDAATAEATIKYPNGDTVARKDHPVSGKLAMLRRGSATIRATYDPSGRLLESIDWGHRRIDLRYDAEEHMTRVAFAAGGREVHVMTFEYGPQGKPTVINVRGRDLTGSIRVKYASNGEIDGVTSAGGARVAAEIQSNFRKLQDAIRSFDAKGSQAPHISFPDFETQKLRFELNEQGERVAAARGQKRVEEASKLASMRVKLAQRLVSRAGEYDAEAMRLIERLIEAGKGDSNQTERALAAAGLLHELLVAVRPNGLTADEFDSFGDAQAWVRTLMGGRFSSQATEVIARIDAHPLLPLDSVRLLRRTVYANPAFWSHESLSSLLPPGVSGVRSQSALIRENGDVLVGTNRGLLVRLHGAWRWMAFDSGAGRFSVTLAANKIDDSSDVRALAESQGVLWVGTKTGLFSLEGGYTAPPKRYTTREGLGADTITGLARPTGQTAGVVVGTARGAARVDVSGVHPVEPLRDIPIRGVASVKDSLLLFATDLGLYDAQKGAYRDPRTPVSVVHEARAPRNSRVWMVSDGRARAADGAQDVGARTIGSSKVTGLGFLPGQGIAALTEKGPWVDIGSRFELLEVPEAGADVAFTTMADGSGSVVLASDQGLHVYEKRGTVDSDGRVYDLLTLPDAAITLVARDSGVSVLKHDDPRVSVEIRELSGSRFLARGPTGDVFAAGDDVVRQLDVKTGKVTPLFELEQTLPKDGSGFDHGGKLTSLLASSDGAVWATAGASLFRWKAGTVEEFSMFRDPTKFPSNTEMLSRVIETFDHRIWVVGSNEGHLTHKGVVLAGGLLEYAGGAFRKLHKPLNDQWFLSAYTTVAPTEAVVSTAGGFAIHDGGRLAGVYNEFKNPSYVDIIDKRKLGLFLGTRGARLREDTWLFGTPNGVLAYRRGRDRKRDTWTLLDELNGLLPDQYLKGLGAWKVHAVETDSHGRIYAGTDRGLLIFDRGFENALGRERSFTQAGEVERDAERDALTDLDTWPIFAKATAQEEAVNRAQAARFPAVLIPPPATADAPPYPVMIDTEKTRLDAELESAKKARDAARVEAGQQVPSLVDLLENDTKEEETRKTIDPGDAHVRYLATKDRLLIRVRTTGGQIDREVAVSSEELLSRARRAWWRLVSNRPGDLGDTARSEIANHGQAPLDEELAWLYEQLLLPIEPLLVGKRAIFVRAHGALTHLPFAALIRTRAPREYAVERFTFAYATSDVPPPRAATAQTAQQSIIFAPSRPTSETGTPGTQLLAGEKAEYPQHWR